ncbi:ABC transporter substrate-binding protein [Streptomyces sp. Ncost-T10-10d]|uniref:ABC transporter substrate-binding protein n=1 Tax=Streptomyces sp. Ncost-T10-10d TaxID=1839774 RepID=UPI00081F2AA1|nr:sugar ABC transporter substrate-binding protein [Streptomyces sp. Ncost-T10-10d]SCF81490.1 multiple sugar transport system substrate-binding protein [Streptomyces sp. Ncost-T10-10d]
MPISPALSRRGFLGTSVLFVAGAAVACSSNPQGTAAANGAKVTLTQWYHQYGEEGTQAAVKRYAEQYTKANPDVAINVVWGADVSQYETKLNAALLGDDAPDIFELGDFRAEMARKGQLEPLDDIYGSAKDGFNKADIDYLTVDGKLYGIKTIDDVMVLYYRKSLLKKAGITPPTTFAELVDAAKKLTDGDAKGLFIGNDGIGDSPYLLAWSQGADLIDGDKVVYADAASSIGGLRDLHADKSLLLGFTTDWYDAGAFTQGAAAMQWCGLWALPVIEKALGDDFGVVPWPAYDKDGKPVARLGGWTQAVHAKSKHKEEAKKYLQWLWIKQSDIQIDWAVKYGFHVPPQTAVAAKTPELSKGAAKDAVAIAADNGVSFPSGWTQAMQTGFIAAAADIAKGSPAESTLKKAQGKAQSHLDKQMG